MKKDMVRLIINSVLAERFETWRGDKRRSILPKKGTSFVRL